MMQARRLLVAITLLMLIVAVLGVQAQTDGTPIAPGESVTNTLSEDNPRALYTITVEADTPTTITLESREFDAYLVLLDADGEVVVEDDDSAGRLNARIETTLEADTDYTIVATSLREYRSEGELFSTGEFTLTVSGESAQVAEATEELTEEATEEADSTPAAGDALSYGDSVEGELTEDAPRAEYTFTAEAGEFVTITLVSTEFDPYLLLLNADGEEITRDDDSAGSLDSQIGNFELVDGGEYTIIASSFGDVQGFVPGFGAYELSIEEGQFTPTATPTVIPSATPIPTATPLAQGSVQGTIEYGETVNGTFDGVEAAHEYTFVADEGDTVNIDLTSTEIDPYVILYDSNGEELTRDDDGGDGLNSFIFEFDIPESGEYTIYASSFGSVTGGTAPLGSYTLTLTEGEFVLQTTPVPTFTPQAGPVTAGVAQGAIEPGQTVSGTLTENEVAHEYTFDGSAGDTVTITMIGNLIDTYLVLYDASGFEVTRNDDGGDGLNSQIAGFTLPSTGEYTILASTYGAVRGFVPGYGDYDLTLETGVVAQTVTGTPFATPTFVPSMTPSPAPVMPTSTPGVDVSQNAVLQGNINVGDFVDGTLGEESFAHRYTFSANSGDIINVALESTDFDTYLILLDSAGNQVTFDDDGGDGLNSLIAAFIIPSNGDYTIIASSYGNIRGFEAGIGDYTLSLTEGSTFDLTPSLTPPTPLPTFTPTPTESGMTDDEEVVAMGVIVPGSVTNSIGDGMGQAHEYTFTGSAGDIVNITLTAADFDTYLFVFDDEFNVVASNDDAEDFSLGLNSQIVDLELPETGEYTIGVASYDWVQGVGNVSGEYTLDFTTTGNAVVMVPTFTPTPFDQQPANEIFMGNLSYGDTINGSLLEGETAHLYNFSGVAGDLVTIRQTSDTLDSYLILRDAIRSTELASNDDDGESLNSLIEDFELPFTGDYTIVVSTYGAARGFTPGSGDYTLALTSGSSEFVGEPTEIVVGDVVDATLVRNQPYQDYRLFAQEGDQIVMTLTSETFDTYLLFFNEEGVELTRDDDSAGNLDSRIGPFEIPADGMYTIQVSSFSYVTGGNISGGDYTLRVEVVEPQPIEYTQSVEGTLDSATSLAIYSFEGEAGDIVTVNLNADNTNTYARLTGANGQINMQSYGGNQPIGPVTLTVDGTYFITVTTYDAMLTQDYSLSLDRITPLEVTFGDEIETNFDDAPALYYTFEAEEGDALNMSVTSDGEVDTTLRLIGPDGYDYYYDDDSGAGFDPEILNYQVGQAGSYVLVVSPYIPGDNGDITVIIDDLGTPSIDTETQVIRLSDKQRIAGALFTADEGETIRLSVRSVLSSGGEPRVTVRQGDEVLATNSLGQVSRLLLEFTVEEAGEVTVTVEDVSYSNAIIELSIERVD